MNENIVSAIRENYDPNLLAKGSSILFELDGIHYHLYSGGTEDDFSITLVRLRDVASASLRFASDDFFWSTYAARCAIFWLFLKIPALKEELLEMDEQPFEEADKISYGVEKNGE